MNTYGVPFLKHPGTIVKHNVELRSAAFIILPSTLYL